MITVTQNNFIPYSQIENVSQQVIIYSGIYDGKIVDLASKKPDRRMILSLTVGIAQLTGKIFLPRESVGACTCFLLSSAKILLKNKKTHKKIYLKGERGSLIIFGGIFREDWGYKIPKKSIILYEDNPLSYIYLSTENRFKYMNDVKSLLEPVEKLPVWKQCLQKHLNLDKMIGSGSYGNVYKSEIDGNRFAVKFSKLKPEALENPFSKYVSSWYEIYFLREIIRPLIQKNICPNLPLLYSEFACDDCNLKLNGENLHVPCAITVVELASGDLKKYLRDIKPSKEEIYSCLFQIMAALHAIQMNGQIMNFDVKKENVLYYNVEPGGYWHYKIHGKSYYVPNYGKIFILNDFGISRSMSPNYPMYKNKNEKTFRLGSRYAIVKNKEFIPLQVPYQPEEDGNMIDSNEITWENGIISKGAQFRMLRESDKIFKSEIVLTKEEEKFLKRKKIPLDTTQSEFFLHPEIIPPFEFYNDTQDCIRMFIGGKRTTQKGSHKRYPKIVTNDLYEELKVYDGKGESMKDAVFSTDPSQVLAGYFIEKFFTMYRKKRSSMKLASYDMS